MKKRDKVSFDPSQGLIVGQTIKEQVRTLLDSGYFDKAESAVFGVSSPTEYDTRWAGSRFDCLALSVAINEHLVRQA
jgi:hypothetical protein